VTATSGNSEFSFIFKSVLNETLLVSLVNTATGKDLVANASKFVKDSNNPSSMQLLEWKIQASNAVLTFKGVNNLKYSVTIGIGSGAVSQVAIDNEKYSDNKLASVQSDTYIYDASGKVAEKRLENTIYGNNGKVDNHTETITIYNKNSVNNQVNQVIKIIDTYGINNKLAVYTFTSREYNADGTIKQERTIIDTYDENGKLSTSDRSTRTNTYNASKVLTNVRTQINNEQYNPSGTLSQTKQANYYYEGARLMAERQEVYTYHNGNGNYTGCTVNIVSFAYYASGRVKERSIASYVYDADQKMMAKTVENYQYSAFGKETAHTSENLSKNNGNTDTELLQRKTLESTIIAYANNKLFTSEMADKPASSELPMSKK
jgi:hypothetical protein